MGSNEGRSRGPGDLQRLIRLITLALAVAALVKELRTPPEEREWNGVVVGFVPYDFRMPTVERIKQRFWDPQGAHLISPRVFGVGWTLNVGRIVELVRQRVSA
ncbi:MAG: DUF5808 domain-containing protein [Cellulomonas sp.]